MRKTITILTLGVLLSTPLLSQTKNTERSSSHPVAHKSFVLEDVFKQRDFIASIGQYKDLAPKDMGNIAYGFEQFTGYVVFTPKGLSYTICKRVESEDKEEAGGKEKEREKHYKRESHQYQVYFEGANPNVSITPIGKAHDYHCTYWAMTEKAATYSGIQYTNLYPGIDLVYYLPENNPNQGFAYSFIVHPGADPSVIKMHYKGDFKKLSIDKDNNLIVHTQSGDVKETTPVAYQLKDNSSPMSMLNINKPENVVASAFALRGHTLAFQIANFDSQKALVIDPFIIPLTSFAVSNIGFNVDYDYQGNLYVYGGADIGNLSGNQEISCYDPSGVLKWHFSGSVPGWAAASVGFYYSDFVVDKANNKIYVGQGFTLSVGSVTIRLLTSNGTYDNFMTTPPVDFNETWDIISVCGSGNAQIYLAGASTSSNLNFGVITPPATNINTQNITGISGSNFQDIVNGVLDPVTQDLFVAFASYIGTPSINNTIQKSPPPYTGSTVGWRVPTGVNSLNEAANKTISGGGGNGSNILAVSPNYLYYYDGINLKAFNKANGATLGSTLVPSISPNALYQTGIAVDACDNVYVGTSGAIKVYHFTGSSFDDSPADIPVSPNHYIYDIKLDDANHLLYVSGNGVVAVVPANQICGQSVFSVQVHSCVPSNGDITVNAINVPANFNLNYLLEDTLGNTIQQSGVTTDSQHVFTNILGGSYQVEVRANEACSGLRSVYRVDLNCCTLVGSGLTYTHNNCQSFLSANTPAAAIPPIQYHWILPDSSSQTGQNIILSQLGDYIVTITDSARCFVRDTFHFTSSLTPTCSVQLAHPILCANGCDGALTSNIQNGTPPFTYQWDTSPAQTTNGINSLCAGTYHLSVIDGNGCTLTSNRTLAAPPAINLIDQVVQPPCSYSTGSISLTSSGGTGNITYSWPSPITGTSLVNAPAGTYTVTVADANGCQVTRAFTLSAPLALQSPINITQPILCYGSCSGALQAVVSGGTGGYTYQWNNFGTGAFQTNLCANAYAVTVTDQNSCTATADISLTEPTALTATAGPSVTIPVGTNATLGGSPTATGGTSGYTYQWMISPSVPGFSSNLANPTVTLNFLANYVCNVTVTDANGCQTNAATIIHTQCSTAFGGFSPDPASFCTGDSLTLSALPPTGTAPFTYIWTLPNGSHTSSSSITANTPGNYSVSTTDANLCISNGTIQVVEKANPSLNPWIGMPGLTHDTIYAGETVSMSALDTAQAGVTYNWNSSPTLTFSAPHDHATLSTANDTVMYAIHIQANLNNCTSDANLWLYVKPNQLVVPNVFTPNGDHENDVFNPLTGLNEHISIVSFKVYDRWGKVVFESKTNSSSWDGFSNGEPMPADAYVYYIVYKRPEDNHDTVKAGTVTLVR